MLNEELEDARAKRNALHYMLGAAFIEIRAANSVQAAKKFADVFHNLPMGLLNCVTSEDYDAQFLKIQERAKRWELDTYVQNLRLLAEKAVENKKSTNTSLLESDGGEDG